MKNKSVKKAIEIENFIREYLDKNTCADVLNQEFHDEFSDRFGGKRKFKYFGAMPNNLAMSWLKKLYSQGILSRGIVSISGQESGFPKWVYSYTLKEGGSGNGKILA